MSEATPGAGTQAEGYSARVPKNPPAITGEEPGEEALKKAMAHLGTPDRQAAVRHLARV